LENGRRNVDKVEKVAKVGESLSLIAENIGRGIENKRKTRNVSGRSCRGWNRLRDPGIDDLFYEQRKRRGDYGLTGETNRK